MKFGILTRGPKLYSTRRLAEAAKARGHSVRMLNTLSFSLLVEEGEPSLFYRGKRLRDIDAVIPRIGASISFFGSAVVRHFEQMGVPTLNSSHAISVARDKLRSLQVLSRHDIGMPPTAFVRDRSEILSAIQRVGGAPVIIKLLEGTQGVGVILAESEKVAEAIIETLQGAKLNVLMQKFVKESKGKDIRAFVVGNRVVAAMRRVAVGQEFRSNVHRGGTAQPVELDEEFTRTAVRAAQIMGLRVAGVDILESNDGPQVMEVNSTPGLEGIENATGVDVADAIIENLEQHIHFPDLDLRQRLTLASGYTVAEFHVVKNSSLAGKSLAETHLRDQDIVVLSITRNGVVIPNPGGSRDLLPGDRLLCYGKAIALRALIPPEESKHRRPRKKRKKSAKKPLSDAEAHTQARPD